MLVTLEDMKDYLGIDSGDTTYDDFLTSQINLISNAIELYCGRKLELASYTQTFYKDDFIDSGLTSYKDLYLYHFPLVTLTSVDEDGESVALTDVRKQDAHALLRRLESDRVVSWFNCVNKIEISYDAGYSTIPLVIQDVVFALVAERYNKKVNGIDVNFGNDVQRVSIPGVMSIDFDYTLQANERSNPYGMILGNYINVLDPFRSERVLLGEIRFNYVV